MVDLISFDDDHEAIVRTPSGTPSKQTESILQKPIHRDSFADLANLMKVKKPYTPVSPPTSKLQISYATTDKDVFGQTPSGSSSLSPLAKSFQVSEPVSGFLGDAQVAPLVTSPSSGRQYEENNLKMLDSWSRRANIFSSIDGIETHQLEDPTPKPSQDPTCTGAVASTGPFHRESLPVPRQRLEEQLGRLRFQNEANKDQKSAMGRALSLRDETIKNLELENTILVKTISESKGKLEKLEGCRGELEYVRTVMATAEEAHKTAIHRLSDEKDHEINKLQSTVYDLEKQVRILQQNREALLTTQSNAEEYKIQVGNLSEIIVQKDRAILELRHKQLEEQMRNTNLEDEVEELKRKTNENNIDELKEKLREKTSQCDRLRNQAKLAEKSFQLSQERVFKAANQGESLSGAAHLVTPHPNSKLPNGVYSCSECYANNITCDNNARCRNCAENNIPCARWRCSLKHRLGDCRMVPCKLPHDAQGWLVLKNPRPEW